MSKYRSGFGPFRRAYTYYSGVEPIQNMVVTPTTIPTAPGALSATAGNTTATISFTPGYDGGSAITNYYYSVDNGNTYTSWGSASIPIIITGLTNGTSYTVVLKGVNANGNSAPSGNVLVTPVAPSPPSPPSTIPTAPSALSATVGNTTATISFTPGYNGGSAITNYYYSVDNGASYIYSTNTTSPIIISGLTNGTTYTVVLKSVNINGNSTPSGSVIVTPHA
jgi:hypothetical protein